MLRESYELLLADVDGDHGRIDELQAVSLLRQRCRTTGWPYYKLRYGSQHHWRTSGTGGWFGVEEGAR